MPQDSIRHAPIIPDFGQRGCRRRDSSPQRGGARGRAAEAPALAGIRLTSEPAGAYAEWQR